ncbi:unnamed protein product, partial [Prorocentrum cordatum]
GPRVVLVQRCRLRGLACQRDGARIQTPALDMSGKVQPTRGERFWGVAIPVSGSLAVGTSTACRLMGKVHGQLGMAPWPACLLLFLTIAGFTTVLVRGDRDAYPSRKP